MTETVELKRYGSTDPDADRQIRELLNTVSSLQYALSERAEPVAWTSELELCRAKNGNAGRLYANREPSEQFTVALTRSDQGASAVIILEGNQSLLALIDGCPLADIEICRRAGVGVNTISGMRSDPKRSLHWVTVRALVEAMGYKICLTK